MHYASGLGYSLGYLGGGVLFLINVIMYSKPEWFGLADGVDAIKMSFLSVAVWWAVFSIPLFRRIPEPPAEIATHSLWKLTMESMATFKKTWAQLKLNPNLFIFMLAYWLYIDGVYTVMTLAVDYGVAIKLEPAHLMGALLVTNFIGFPCAYFSGYLVKRWGSKTPLLIAIGMYGIAVIAATWMSQAWHFFALAAMIGMVQGGIQAISRSLFGRMVPKEQSGEYFGFFNLVGRFASILGPLVVAVGVTVTGNSRMGMLGLLILFVSGGWLLMKVKEPA
jgi:UMF1 family MFS transporter